MAAQPASEMNSTLEHQHEHLKDLIRDVRQLLKKQSELSEQTIGAMQNLGQHVLSHFAMEENSPLFRDTGEQASNLRRAVAQLLEQHGMLRNEVEALSALAVRQRPLPAGWMEFSELFERFSQQLLDHEHNENEIWQKAHNEDMGTKD